MGRPAHSPLKLVTLVASALFFVHGASTYAATVAGNALELDGSNDLVLVPDRPSSMLELPDDFTIEAWVKLPPWQDYTAQYSSVIVTKGLDNFNEHLPYFLGIWNATNALVLSLQTTVSYQLLSGTSNLGSAQWVHVASVGTSTDIMLYVNGVEEAAAPRASTQQTSADPLRIGGLPSPHGSELYLTGAIDEVRLWNVARTPQEIAEHYNRAVPPDAPGLVGYWKFDEGTNDQTVPDCSLLANDGTLGATDAVGADDPLRVESSAPLIDAAPMSCFQVGTRIVPAAKLGDPFSFQFQARFATTPLTWSVVGGVPPPGLTLGSDGVLSGTPTRGGDFTYTVMVADDAGMATKEVTQQVSLTLPPPEIRVNKSGTIAVPGRNVDYFILVENVGVSTGENFDAVEVLEPEFQFVSADPLPTPTSGATIRWNVLALAPGDWRLLTYRVKLDSAVPIGTTVNGPEYNTCPNPDCVAADTVCHLCAGGCFDPCNEAKIICTAACGGATAQNTTRGPEDPNEKLVLSARFVRPDQTLVYPIHFENRGSVEAQDVFIRDVLDSNLDLATVEFITPGGASLDTGTRTVKWDLLGRNLPAGESDYVVLSVRPLPGLPSGTEIRNTASIQFEVFAVMPTNEVVNVIDSTAPECLMTPLPAEVVTLAFPVSWTTSDAVGEVEAVSVFVSTDGGPYAPFVEKTTATAATFVGEAGRRYDFLCVARDTAGNAEVQVPSAETTTLVNPPMCRVPLKSTLVLKNRDEDRKDQLSWKWAKGEATTKPNLGSPMVDTSYNLLIQSTEGPFSAFFIPPGALWKDLGTKGFKYAGVRAKIS